MPVLLLVTTSALSLSLSSQLRQYQTDQAAAGWTVNIFAMNPLTGEDLAAAIVGQEFDMLFIVGPLPTVYQYGSPDGHEMRNIPYDTGLCPGKPVGRIDFHDLDGVDELAAYRLWFQKRHNYALNGCSQYPLTAILDDHFNYPGFSSIGDMVMSQMAPMASFITRGAEIQVSDHGPDQIALQTPCTFWLVESGGMWAGWLFAVGDEPVFIQYPPKAIFTSVFGSYIINSDQHNSLLRAIVTGPDVICSVYDYFGGFQWLQLLRGVPIGWGVLNGTPGTVLIGDPTMTLDATTLALVPQLQPISDRLTALETQVKALQTGQPAPAPAPAPPTPSGPVTVGNITITSATYERVDGGGSADVTAELGKLQGAGTPYYVYSSTAPCLHDPFYGFVKRLRVNYSVGGVVRPERVFGQYDLISLA